MLNNYDFIPFRSSAIPTGSSLVFAPHPDDETFGLGGTILQMTDNDQEVYIVMMTDGGKGGDIEERKRELEAATTILGAKVCHYFSAPDGALEVSTQNILRVSKLIKTHQPDTIFFPSPLEYHPDHRATAWLVWNAIQNISFTGNIYSYEIANQSFINQLIDITPVMSRKKEAIQVYASQQAQLDYLNTIVSSNALRAYTMPKEVQYAEAFFHFPDTSLDLMSYYYKTLQKYHGNTHTEKLPLISVLIRTKDRPELLKNALESVSRQSYKKLEVNIVNDGGVDVQSVVDAFNFDYCHVKTHNISQGRAAAANALLDMTQGGYAIFLDDDDTFDADHIENLVNLIMKNLSVLAAYSGIRVGNDLNMPPYNEPYNAALLRRMNFIPFHAVLFSSKLLEMGCQFDESLLVYEDWDFWLQVSQHTEFYHLNKITATYNVNGQSGAGGAGGHSTKDLDLHQLALQVYKKWQKVWSPDQIAQTFRALASLNANEVQKVNAQMKTLKEENQQKLQAKEKTIVELQKSNNQQIKSLKQQQDWSQRVISSYLRALDTNYAADRKFQIKPAYLYTQGCMDLFEQVFGQKMPIEFWNWKYNGVHWRNVCAVDKDDKVVGFYGGMKRDIIAFGQREMALQPSDTMVLKNARGGFKKSSLFYVMTKTYANLNASRSSDAYITFGFPNKRHLSLGVASDLYREVDAITQLHWELQADGFAQSYNLHPLQEADSDNVNALWDKMSMEYADSLIGVRDYHYLVYRYIKHPVYKYDLIGFKNDTGVLLGVAVIKKEGDGAKLMDIIAEKDSMQGVVSSLCAFLYKVNIKRLTAWITSSHRDFLLTTTAVITATDVVIPLLYEDTMSIDLDKIQNSWFLMYGDTDFI